MRSQSPRLFDTSGLIKASRHQPSSTDDVGLFFLISSCIPQSIKRIFFFKPAYTALFVSCLSAILASPLLVLLQAVIPQPYNSIGFVLLQATLAVMFAVAVGLDSWWRIILFVFPMTAWFLQGLDIPNWIYLLGFVFSLSLFWKTYQTQVPFYPSRPKVWRQLAKLIPQDRQINMIDIGSGLGDLSMYLSKQRPNSKFSGIEIAPLPWLISKIRAKLTKSKAEFKLGDYTKLNFAKYDIVFAYLSPAAMPSLWKKAVSEMVIGSLLVSYEFEIVEEPPTYVLQQYDDTPPIYVWEF